MATGINQIIDESGVAKATFYAHFPAKEDLCLAYLRSMAAQETALLQRTLEKRRSPISRFMAPIEILGPWLEETHFRGCAFLNIASEVPDASAPARKVGRQFYQSQQQTIESLTRDLIKSDPKRYSGLEPTAIAQRYNLIFLGVVGLCEIYQSIDPLKEGSKLVRAFVE